jgi:hypothetical protein
VSAATEVAVFAAAWAVVCVGAGLVAWAESRRHPRPAVRTWPTPRELAGAWADWPVIGASGVLAWVLGLMGWAADSWPAFGAGVVCVVHVAVAVEHRARRAARPTARRAAS